ncbi:MAG: hypothetical protein AAB511_02755 [Patescibacteria group bacterium]
MNMHIANSVVIPASVFRLFWSSMERDGSWALTLVISFFRGNPSRIYLAGEPANTEDVVNTGHLPELAEEIRKIYPGARVINISTNEEVVFEFHDDSAPSKILELKAHRPHLELAA